MKVLVVNNDVDRAIRILKKKLNKEGVPQELKRREFYEKPSEKKRREKNASKRRHQKRLQEKASEEF